MSEEAAKPQPTESQLTRAWNIAGAGYLKWMPIARFVVALANEFAEQHARGKAEGERIGEAKGRERRWLSDTETLDQMRGLLKELDRFGWNELNKERFRSMIRYREELEGKEGT